MKKLTGFLVVGLIAGAISMPAFARISQPQGAAAAQTAQTDEAARSKMYEDFLAARKKWKDSQTANAPTAADDYKAAYDIAKQYVEKYGAADDEYAKYVKNFVSTYDTYQKATRRANVEKLVNDKKYADAYTLGKQVLADDPNDLATLYVLSRGALIATTSGDEKYNADAAGYAKKAIELIDQGKTFQEGKPIPNKDDTVALLNYELGVFSLKSSPTDAAQYFLKVANNNNALKKDAQTYALLGDAYEAEYLKVATDFKTKFPDATAQATPEGKAATEQVNAVTDRLIDALARAVAYSGTDPKYATLKTKSMDRLTELYKYRHEGSDAGLKELIAGITSKPLPPITGAQPAGTTSSTVQPTGDSK
jgi:hypothetical protein